MFEADEDAGYEIPDPQNIKNNDDLREHLTKARTVLKSLGDDKAAQAKAISDLKGELQALQQAHAAPKARNIPAQTDERALQRRYLDDSGKLHLKSMERELTFGGRRTRVKQRGLLDDPEVTGEWQAELQKLVSRRSLVRLCAKNRDTPETDAEILRVMSKAPAGIRNALEKAITDSAGSGAEWIPDGTFPEIYEEFAVPNLVPGIFALQNMPRTTMDLPRLSTGARPYKRNAINSDDPSNYTASTPVTDKLSHSVPAWSIRIVYDEMDGEDAVVAMEGFIRQLASSGINDGYADTTINGDTAATHQDALSDWNIRSRWGASGLGGSADHRRIFKGLRAEAYDRSQTVNMGSAQTLKAVMSTLIGGMGERAASDIAVIPSIEVFYQKMLADDNVITLDKLGAGATIITGQLGSVFGHPIVPTRWLSADLAASGLYTDGSDGLSGVLAVDRSAFRHAQRRGLLVEMERQIVNGSVQVVATLRRGLWSPAGSSEAIVRYGFNWLS